MYETIKMFSAKEIRERFEVSDVKLYKISSSVNCLKMSTLKAVYNRDLIILVKQSFDHKTSYVSCTTSYKYLQISNSEGVEIINRFDFFKIFFHSPLFLIHHSWLCLSENKEYTFL